jgi:hypothetical protein
MNTKTIKTIPTLEELRTVTKYFDPHSCSIHLQYDNTPITIKINKIRQESPTNQFSKKQTTTEEHYIFVSDNGIKKEVKECNPLDNHKRMRYNFHSCEIGRLMNDTDYEQNPIHCGLHNNCAYYKTFTENLAKVKQVAEMLRPLLGDEQADDYKTDCFQSNDHTKDHGCRINILKRSPWAFPLVNAQKSKLEDKAFWIQIAETLSESDEVEVTGYDLSV